MKSEHQRRVEEMMNLIPGQEVPSGPVIPDKQTLALRISLMLEEVLETAVGAGVTVSIASPDGEILALTDGVGKTKWPIYSVEADGECDVVEFVDGLADIQVTTTGSFSACGLEAETFLKIVDENNLKKFGPGHSIREDGKLIKPPGFVGPSSAIANELEASGLLNKKKCSKGCKCQ